MAWSNPLDPATPADTDPAAEGDDRIREIKAGLEERLQSLLPEWPEGDPLRLRAAGVGDLADRPAAPLGDGELFIAHSPEGRLYYGAEGAWNEINAAALLGALVEVKTSELLNAGIPSGAGNLVLVPVDGNIGTQEVIGWRWRAREVGETFIPWRYNAAEVGAPIPSDRPFGNIDVTRFWIQRVSGGWELRLLLDNTTGSTINIDVQVTMTLLKVA